MAMKMNSKFERMDAKPSATKRPAASIPRPGTIGGAASGNAINDRRRSAQQASRAILPKIAYAKAPTGEGPTGDAVMPLKPLNAGTNPKAIARRKALQTMGKTK